MEKLFSIPMDHLMLVMVSIFAVTLLVTAIMGFRNPVLVKLGIRNIPRRPAQTVLIVIGLMLSTTIIAAALALGDTISSSIRQTALDGVGNTDISLTSPLFAAFGDDYLVAEDFSDILQVVGDDDRIDGVMPQVRQVLPIVNKRTNRAESRAEIVGLDASSMTGFGPIESINGLELTLESLDSGQIYLSQDAADQLEAVNGDTIDLIAPTGRYELNVRGIIKGRGLAGNRPDFASGSQGFVTSIAIGKLADIQPMLGRIAKYDRIELSVLGGTRPSRQLSKEVSKDLRVKFTNRTVAAELMDHLGITKHVELIEQYAANETALSEVQRQELKSLTKELRAGEITNEFRSLLGDNTVAGLVVVALEQGGMNEAALSAVRLLSKLERVRVESTKSELLDIADLVGSFFTTLFTIFGSFSIMVGLLLIFLVFAMLAAARSTEMGIARAIGTKRRQLVMLFVFEGFAYALSASLAGTVLGVLASLVLVQTLQEIIPDDVDFTIRYAIQFQSLVVAFSAGVLITMITVAVSAFRVSKLNISVAIRGLPEQFTAEDTFSLTHRFALLGKATAGPFYFAYKFVRTARGRGSSRVVLVFGMLLGVPVLGWSIWFLRIVVAAFGLISPYVKLGWPLIALGLLFSVLGMQLDSASLFSVGVSILFVGIGLFLKVLLSIWRLRDEFVARISSTVIGIPVLVFWALPSDALNGLTGELNGDIEMFFLSGIFLVASAVWLLMHNTELVMWPLNTILGRFRGLWAVVRIATAYPMAARFRTGLTLAMFALVIFTLMVFAVLNEAFSNTILDNPDRVHGGYDLTAIVSPELPIDDIVMSIEEANELDLGDFNVIAESVFLPAQARQTGSYLGEEVKELRYLPLNIWAVDDSFARTNRFELVHFDPSYGTTANQIFSMLSVDPTLAVASAYVLPSQGGFGEGGFGGSFKVEGIKAGDESQITAFGIEIRAPSGDGEPVERTVIGVVDPAAGIAETTLQGSWIMTSSKLIPDFTARPVPLNRFDMRVEDSTMAKNLAPVVEQVFLKHGVDVTVNYQALREEVDIRQTFNKLFIGFMGLGLLVGVASLGVISFRAVVERRQAIGVQRALGFSRRMVLKQFLLESSLISLLGTVLGLGLGFLVSWHLVNDIGKEFDGLAFSVPWTTVVAIVVLAYLFSLFTAFWPARQASMIYPAEALRYE